MADLPRLLQLADVADILSTSSAQVYAMVRRGELTAVKIGGRGQWRVDVADLEEYIARQKAATRAFIDAHPFEGSLDAEAAEADDLTR